MFEQVIRHAGSEAIKLLITYSSLLCGVILKQYPDIVKEEGLTSYMVAPRKISFNYKLFQSHHVADISMPTSFCGSVYLLVYKSSYCASNAI